MARSLQPKITRRGKYFTRDLGWKIDSRGKRIQHRFVLGRDRSAAERAVRVLEQIWELRVEDAKVYNRSLWYDEEPQQPLWDEESLWVANAVRQGQVQLTVPCYCGPLAPDFNGPGRLHGAIDESAYAAVLHGLKQRYPFMFFVPGDPEALRRGQDRHRQVGEARARQARLNAAIANAPIPAGAGQSLYQAIDACAAHILATKIRSGSPTAWAVVQAKNVLRLKKSHGDLAVERIDYNAVERMKLFWDRRPAAAKTGRPISLATVEAQAKALRTFFKWLHRDPDWGWRGFPDVEDLFAHRPDRLRTDEEVASLKRGVATFTIDELMLLYRYATDRERVLILLGLNLGFARAECVTLRKDELHADEAPPSVKRVRRKSRVYGEFALWPETLVALRWLEEDQREFEPPAYPLVLATTKGQPVPETGIANAWNRLLARVRGDHPGFRRLSFKHLRKTAGQLVRNVADGETAGVFLCHGRPVRTDDLLDAYTNRDFSKVHAALAKSRELLASVFGAAPDAFASPRKWGGPNISLGRIDMIRRLHADGLSVGDIAVAVGVTRPTVYRHLPRRSGVVTGSGRDGPLSKP